MQKKFAGFRVQEVWPRPARTGGRGGVGRMQARRGRRAHGRRASAPGARVGQCRRGRGRPQRRRARPALASCSTGRGAPTAPPPHRLAPPPHSPPPPPSLAQRSRRRPLNGERVGDVQPLQFFSPFVPSSGRNRGKGTQQAKRAIWSFPVPDCRETHGRALQIGRKAT